MRFLNNPHTLSEYNHNKFRKYEVLGLTATSAIALGGLAVSAGGLAYEMSKGNGGGSPSYNPNGGLGYGQNQFDQLSGQSLDYQKSLYNQEAPQSLQYGQDLFNQAQNQGLQFAKAGTQSNIDNQNLVTAGSGQQRELALNQLNGYIQGQVPQDVQQNINRQVAQNLGGGFNLFSGGGQAPQNFARNIGQTSLQLSQYGLSAAPTWQQLANSMVVSPSVGLGAGLSAASQGAGLAQGAGSAGIGLANAAMNAGNSINENQYQSQVNQYQAKQLQDQSTAQNLMALGGLGISAANGLNTANYYNSMASPQQGSSAYSNQFGTDMQSGSGFYETPAAIQAAYGQGAIPAYYSGGGNSGYYNQGFTG
jgi:hypothetical protein